MQEIERRFWLDQLPKKKYSDEQEIVQGYYTDQKNTNSRIRKCKTTKSTTYTQTIKHGKWLVREEIETKITAQAWKKLRPAAEKTSLTKTRYILKHQKHEIEINVFHDDLEGLILVEVEFESKKEADTFKVPERFGVELTNNEYSTSYYLAKNGKKDLEKSVKPYEQIIQENLADFYDQESSKYASTRKKLRPEAHLFIDEIKKIAKDSITILELWCGSGRLLEQINTLTDKKIDYIWVDISEGLLDEAKKIKTAKNITTTFIKSDMLSFLKDQKQESLDCIIAIASVQHLASKKTRILFSKYSYRALVYGGHFIMSNRSFSLRFVKKYRKALIENTRNILFPQRPYERNSLLLPRKTKQKTFKRFYHIFTKAELREISEQWGFLITTLDYVNKEWELISDRKHATNTIVIWEKTIFTTNDQNIAS